jgi:hypothetical protein
MFNVNNNTKISKLLDNMLKTMTTIKVGYPLIKVDNNVLSGEMGEWWGLTFPFLFLQNKMDIQPLIKLM